MAAFLIAVLILIGVGAALATLKSDEPILIRICGGMASVAAFYVAGALTICL